MEKMIKDVIKKVRVKFKDDKRDKIRDCLKMEACVEIREIKGELKIKKIKMGYYDVIEITDKEVTFKPEFGSSIGLLNYNNFEHLLSLE